MYVLDSDVFSYYFVRKSAKPELRFLIESTPYEKLWITTITIEESVSGVCKLIRDYQQKKGEEHKKLIFAYSLFPLVLEALSKPQVLPFDEDAYDEYLKIPDSIKSGRAHDCRIASIAISKGYTLVTNNSKDFPHIEREVNKKAKRLNVEYWGQVPPS